MTFGEFIQIANSYLFIFFKWYMIIGAAIGGIIALLVLISAIFIRDKYLEIIKDTDLMLRYNIVEITIIIMIAVIVAFTFMWPVYFIDKLRKGK